MSAPAAAAVAPAASWSRPRRQCREKEPAWHRKLRRRRSDDRTLARVVSAVLRLAKHHGSEVPRPLCGLRALSGKGYGVQQPATGENPTSVTSFFIGDATCPSDECATAEQVQADLSCVPGDGVATSPSDECAATEQVHEDLSCDPGVSSQPVSGSAPSSSVALVLKSKNKRKKKKAASGTSAAEDVDLDEAVSASRAEAVSICSRVAEARRLCYKGHPFCPPRDGVQGDNCFLCHQSLAQTLVLTCTGDDCDFTVCQCCCALQLRLEGTL